MTTTLLVLIMKYATLYNVDPFLAMSVAKVESNYDQSAVGTLGEIGVFQVRPELYPKANLKDLRTNVRIGIKHLAKALKECKHKDGFTGVICYNGGVALGSRVKHPTLFPYYKRIAEVYKK